jgi:hypothetical protein
MRLRLELQVPLPHGARFCQLDDLLNALDEDLEIRDVGEIVRIDKGVVEGIVGPELEVSPAAGPDDRRPHDNLLTLETGPESLQGTLDVRHLARAMRAEVVEEDLDVRDPGLREVALEEGRQLRQAGARHGTAAVKHVLVHRVQREALVAIIFDRHLKRGDSLCSSIVRQPFLCLRA